MKNPVKKVRTLKCQIKEKGGNFSPLNFFFHSTSMDFLKWTQLNLKCSHCVLTICLDNYYQSSNQSSALFQGSRKVHFENSYYESNWWVGIWKRGIWRGTTNLWQTSLPSMGVFYYAGSGQSTQWFVTKKYYY